MLGSRALALAVAVLVLAPARVRANGRAPATMSIHVRQGRDEDLLAGLTFGVALSHDGGATWQWMCEKAVGYGGIYDPDYAFSPTGAVFATTTNGLVVMRDGCTFAAAPSGTAVVGQVEIDPVGAVLYAASDPGDSSIYRSSDDGVTFPSSSAAGQPGDTWDSLAVAPSDPMRVYLAGFRLPSGQPKQLLLYTSADGGATFSALSTTSFTQTTSSQVYIAGVSPTDPQTVYVHVTNELGNAGDGIYKSTNAGASFTKIFSIVDQAGLAFLARRDGSCVAGTRSSGSFTSTQCDLTWTELVTPPHIGCLVETSAGVVLACTDNYGGDGFGIMKSTDLATWTGVLRYQDIAAPVACAAGTVQHDTCGATMWCTLAAQLGIASPACTPVADGAVDAPPDASTPSPHAGGCCDAGGTGGSWLAGACLALIGARGRRGPRRHAVARTHHRVT